MSIGQYAGVVCFKKNGGYVLHGGNTGGPEYLVVIPNTTEVVARITKNGVEKASDGVVLKLGVTYHLYTEAEA